MCNCWQALFINFFYKAETVVDSRNESESASETSCSAKNPVVQQMSCENNGQPLLFKPNLDKELCHGLNLHVFTYNELKLATRNFCPNSSLGHGGFGTVYKGWINEIGPEGTKTITVAVKVLNHEGSQGHREWLAEVNLLGQLHHPHLVKLIGYACEDNHRLLVYEFIPFGSLDDHLFSKTSVPLSWTIRMKIALGAAKGLAFLHGAEKPVIYRDFKTSNILIDSDHVAKISDFGLAKDGPGVGQTHVTTRVLGTHGYAAPEYVMTGHLTTNSDVYSFGVVFLELLTGRKAFDKKRPRAEQNLVEWARPYLSDKKKLLRIIDPRLDGMYSVRGVQKAAFLALHCLSEQPKMRPMMTHVVEALESIQNTRDVFYTYKPSSGMTKDGQQQQQQQSSEEVF